jgi:predicted Zn-dependent protease
MSNNESPKYFDLHTNGIGYLNRVREVTPKEGTPFLSVTIAALRGSVDNVHYTHFECRVSGRQAQQVVRQVKPAVEGKLKVLIGFTLSDLYAETFTFKSGDKAGETGVSLKARLLRVSWAKVDGQPFYKEQEHAA